MAKTTENKNKRKFFKHSEPGRRISERESGKLKAREREEREWKKEKRENRGGKYKKSEDYGLTNKNCH